MNFSVHSVPQSAPSYPVRQSQVLSLQIPPFKQLVLSHGSRLQECNTIIVINILTADINDFNAIV